MVISLWSGKIARWSIVGLVMGGSGELKLEEGFIRYCSRVFGDWEVPLSAVRVIGECTNQLGPFADDYFLCFSTGPWMWREASFYAEGRDEFLSDLERALGVPMQLELNNSTDFASRVLWPASLSGLPMFKYTDVPQKGLLRRFLTIPKNIQTYSDRVAEFLANPRNG